MKWKGWQIIHEKPRGCVGQEPIVVVFVWYSDQSSRMDHYSSHLSFTPCWTVVKHHSSTRPAAGLTGRGRGGPQPGATFTLTIYILKLSKFSYKISTTGPWVLNSLFCRLQNIHKTVVNAHLYITINKCGDGDRCGGWSGYGVVEDRCGGWSGYGVVEDRCGGWSGYGVVEDRCGGWSRYGVVEDRCGGWSRYGVVEDRNWPIQEGAPGTWPA